MAARKKAKKSGASAKGGASKKKRAAKKAPKRKAKTRKAVKKTAKKASRSAAKKKATPRKATKKAPVRAGKQIAGEGDYQASRSFLKDQADFVKKNKARIPAMGKAAERALDGREGASLRAAETEARKHAATNEEAEPAADAFVIPPG